MSLLYKAGWEEAKEHLRVWWAHEDFGRCAMWLQAPRQKPLPMPPEMPRPATAKERWTNLDYLSNRLHREWAGTYYGAEAFPRWNPGDPGNATHAAFLGCPITLDFETGWLEPILAGEELDWRSLRLDENSEAFQFALRMLKRAAEEGKGKAIPTIGAFGGSGDTLSALRGSERLLIDLIDRPEQVREAEIYLMDMWCSLYERFYEIIKNTAGGSTCWFGLWAPGKFYAPHNDFSYMISPRMFRDIFLPTIKKQTEFLDYCIYHLDGIGAFAHLDALLELPRLKAIQVLPGEGKPGPLHYIDILRKVQAAGKNLHIGLHGHEVEAALEMLSSRGLYISVYCEKEDHARDILKTAEKRSRVR